MLLARENKGLNYTAAFAENFQQLPLQNLPIADDTLNVFNDLGINRIEDLRQVPADQLIGRYGQEFKDVIDVLEQKGERYLTPNIKENKVSWVYELDSPVEDFAQLIFVLNHGLDKLLSQVSRYGLSTEQLDIF